MNIKVLFSFTSILISLANSYSQETYTHKRTNLNFCKSFYQDPINKSTYKKKVGTQTGRVEYSYGISNHLSAAAAVGYGSYSIKSGLFDHYTFDSPHRFLYGGVINYQLLPFLIKSNDFRLDLYLSGKLGGIYFFSPYNSIIPLEEKLYYGAYAGFACYFFRHAGCFIEYGYGNMTNLR